MHSHFSRFQTLISRATEGEVRDDPTLCGQLALASSGTIMVSYAPFDHIQTGARVVIIGITPGAQQAGNAIMSARRDILAGYSNVDILARAKAFASFSGPMRTNLVSMLDHIGLAKRIGVKSTSTLWEKDCSLVHFTSALRYPVFINRANYSGAPSMTETPILRKLLDDCLTEEGNALSSAVWIPLGPKAMQGVGYLIERGIIASSRVLEGLPHPSGANAERIAYFLGRKPRALLSTKTEPVAIDRAKERLLAQVAALVNA